MTQGRHLNTQENFTDNGLLASTHTWYILNPIYNNIIVVIHILENAKTFLKIPEIRT